MHHYICTYQDGKENSRPETVEVDGSSVGLYTCVSDYTGSDIFEGDLCCLPNGQVGEVTNMDGAWGLYTEICEGTANPIDYNAIESLIPKNRKAQFLHCRNFISFRELINSFSPENVGQCNAVCLLDDDCEVRAFLYEYNHRKDTLQVQTAY